MRPVDEVAMAASQKRVDETYNLAVYDGTENCSSVVLCDGEDLTRNRVRSPDSFLEALAFPVLMLVLEQAHLRSQHSSTYTDRAWSPGTSGAGLSSVGVKSMCMHPFGSR